MAVYVVYSENDEDVRRRVAAADNATFDAFRSKVQSFFHGEPVRILRDGGVPVNNEADYQAARSAGVLEFVAVAAPPPPPPAHVVEFWEGIPAPVLARTFELPATTGRAPLLEDIYRLFRTPPFQFTPQQLSVRAFDGAKPCRMGDQNEINELFEARHGAIMAFQVTIKGAQQPNGGGSGATPAQRTEISSSPLRSMAAAAAAKPEEVPNGPNAAATSVPPNGVEAPPNGPSAPQPTPGQQRSSLQDEPRSWVTIKTELGDELGTFDPWRMDPNRRDFNMLKEAARILLGEKKIAFQEPLLLERSDNSVPLPSQSHLDGVDAWTNITIVACGTASTAAMGPQSMPGHAQRPHRPGPPSVVEPARPITTTLEPTGVSIHRRDAPTASGVDQPNAFPPSVSGMPFLSGGAAGAGSPAMGVAAMMGAPPSTIHGGGGGATGGASAAPRPHLGASSTGAPVSAPASASSPLRGRGTFTDPALNSQSGGPSAVASPQEPMRGSAVTTVPIPLSRDLRSVEEPAFRTFQSALSGPFYAGRLSDGMVKDLFFRSNGDVDTARQLLFVLGYFMPPRT